MTRTEARSLIRKLGADCDETIFEADYRGELESPGDFGRTLRKLARTVAKVKTAGGISTVLALATSEPKR